MNSAVQCTASICSAASSLNLQNTDAKALHFWQFWMSVKKRKGKKKAPSKQQALLYESGPLTSV